MHVPGRLREAKENLFCEKSFCEKLFCVEKLFCEKLFSKLGCLREVVLEKSFCAKPFYASRPGSCFEEVVLLEDVLRFPTLKALLLLPPHVLRTDHADRGRLGTDDHN